MAMYWRVMQASPCSLADQPLGSGGEGDVFDVAGQPRLVAKIYRPEILRTRPELEEKLRAMVHHPMATTGAAVFAWPQDLLQDAGGHFCGFLMPKISDYEPLVVGIRLHERGQLAKPRYNTRWSVVAAYNLSLSFQAAHQAGIVLGDNNSFNEMINQNAEIALIDCDCYGLRDSRTGRVFPPAPGGVAQYVPPELQNQPYRFSDKTDNFALAVLIFQLLFNGAHPFSANGKLEENIRDRSFDPKASLPGEAPDFRWVGKEMQALFRRAFLGKPEERPPAGAWVSALEQLLHQLKRCPKDPTHYFVKRYTSACPWCAAAARLEREPLRVAPKTSHLSARRSAWFHNALCYGTALCTLAPPFPGWFQSGAGGLPLWIAVPVLLVCALMAAGCVVQWQSEHYRQAASSIHCLGCLLTSAVLVITLACLLAILAALLFLFLQWLGAVLLEFLNSSQGFTLMLLAGVAFAIWVAYNAM